MRRAGIVFGSAMLIAAQAAGAPKNREWKAGVVEWATRELDSAAFGLPQVGGAPPQTVRETIDIGTPEAIYTGEQTVLPRQTLGYRPGHRVRFIIDGKKLIVLDRNGKERKLKLKGEYPRSAAERERRAVAPH